MRSGLFALRGAGLVVVMVAVPALGVTAADAHDSVKVKVTPSTVRPGGEVKIKVTGCENPRAAAARSNAFVADSELAARRGGDRESPLNGEAKVKSSAKDGTYEVDVWCDGHDHQGAVVFEVNQKPKPKSSTKPKTSPKPKSSTKPESKPKPKRKPSATVSATPESKPEPKTVPKAEPKPKAESKPVPKPVPDASGRQAEPSQAHPRPSDRRASPVAPVRAGGGGRTTSSVAADEGGPGTPHTVIGLVLAGVAAVAVAFRIARRKRSAARDSD